MSMEANTNLMGEKVIYVGRLPGAAGLHEATVLGLHARAGEAVHLDLEITIDGADREKTPLRINDVPAAADPKHPTTGTWIKKQESRGPGGPQSGSQAATGRPAAALPWEQNCFRVNGAEKGQA